MPAIRTRCVLWATLLTLSAASCASGRSEAPRLDTGHNADDMGQDGPGDTAGDPTAGDPSDPPVDPVDGEGTSDLGDAADTGDEEAGGTSLLVETDDWPDCLDPADCGASAHNRMGIEITLDPATGEVLVDGDRYPALMGTIEAPEGHSFLGYDLDLIAVNAPVRTVVTVSVEQSSPSSVIDPFITAVDFGRPGDTSFFDVVSSNDNRATGDPAARTVIASPYGDAPFFLWVDHAANVTGPGVQGGPDYTYVLRFQTSPFAPTEIDVSTGSGSITGAEVAAAGDMHFYRFVPPAAGDWTVTFSTLNQDFLGYLIGFDTRGGGLRPIDFAGAEDWLPDIVLDHTNFDFDGGLEHVFAVSEWFGEGSNTRGFPLTYNLVVEPDAR